MCSLPLGRLGAGAHVAVSGGRRLVVPRGHRAGAPARVGAPNHQPPPARATARRALGCPSPPCASWPSVRAGRWKMRNASSRAAIRRRAPGARLAWGGVSDGAGALGQGPRVAPPEPTRTARSEATPQELPTPDRPTPRVPPRTPSQKSESDLEHPLIALRLLLEVTRTSILCPASLRRSVALVRHCRGEAV